jgi:hypothetical protein
VQLGSQELPVLVVLLVGWDRQVGQEQLVPLVCLDLLDLMEVVDRWVQREILDLLDHLDCQGQVVRKGQMVRLDPLVLQDQPE